MQQAHSRHICLNLEPHIPRLNRTGRQRFSIIGHASIGSGARRQANTCFVLPKPQDTGNVSQHDVCGLFYIAKHLYISEKKNTFVPNKTMCQMLLMCFWHPTLMIQMADYRPPLSSSVNRSILVSQIIFDQGSPPRTLSSYNIIWRLRAIQP